MLPPPPPPSKLTPNQLLTFGTKKELPLPFCFFDDDDCGPFGNNPCCDETDGDESDGGGGGGNRFADRVVATAPVDDEFIAVPAPPLLSSLLLRDFMARVAADTSVADAKAPGREQIDLYAVEHDGVVES